MRKALVMTALLLVTAQVHALDYYVATTGADSNVGTVDKPFRTLGRAEAAALPGDTVFVRGGVYSFTGTSATGRDGARRL